MREQAVGDRAVAIERRDETPVLVEVREGLGKGVKRVLAALRPVMGSIFMWAFLDKMFALGFTTGRLEDGSIDFFADGAAALNGGLPTFGFLGMWSVAIWPESNPVFDDHLVYALVLVVLALTAAGSTWGLGARWSRTRLVPRFPILN